MELVSPLISLRSRRRHFVFIPLQYNILRWPMNTGAKCPRFLAMNGTNGNIICNNYYNYYRCNQKCSWKTMANKGKQVKVVLERMYHRWCGFSCSCGHLEIQNGTYADGSTTTRMCWNLLGSVIIYSHVGHGLRIQAVILSSWWASFRASYTIITHEDTVSDGKQLQRLWVLAITKTVSFVCVVQAA